MEQIQERIATIISTKNMTNAQFAEKVGVQPANISHIMSGRNKPSLDLVIKILKRFPEIRSDWLINGKGSMTREYDLFGMAEEKKSPEERINKRAEEAERERQEMSAKISQTGAVKKPAEPDKIAEKQPYMEGDPNTVQSSKKFEKPELLKGSQKKVERIVIFYEDRSFRTYHPDG